MALALLPVNQIELAFEEIVNDAPASMEELLDYFHNHRIKKVKLSLWNVSNLDVRTNNHVEGERFDSACFIWALPFYESGWNNQLNKRMIRSHPNIWAFLECLKKEEVVFQQQLMKAKAGGQAKKNLSMQKHLDTLRMRFVDDKINCMEYLEGLSLLLAIKKWIYIIPNSYPILFEICCPFSMA